MREPENKIKTNAYRKQFLPEIHDLTLTNIITFLLFFGLDGL